MYLSPSLSHGSNEGHESNESYEGHEEDPERSYEGNESDEGSYEGNESDEGSYEGNESDDYLLLLSPTHAMGAIFSCLVDFSLWAICQKGLNFCLALEATVRKRSGTIGIDDVAGLSRILSDLCKRCTRVENFLDMPDWEEA